MNKSGDYSRNASLRAPSQTSKSIGSKQFMRLLQEANANKESASPKVKRSNYQKNEFSSMMVEPLRRETADTDFTSVNLNARSTVRGPASRIASSHFNGNFDGNFDEEQKTLPQIRESRSSLRQSETKFFVKRTKTAT